MQHQPHVSVPGRIVPSQPHVAAAIPAQQQRTAPAATQYHAPVRHRCYTQRRCAAPTRTAQDFPTRTVQGLLRLLPLHRASRQRHTAIAFGQQRMCSALRRPGVWR